MAVRTDFVAGEVLAAQDLDDTFAAKVDYALPVNTQTGTTYTFVLADGLRLTTASNASASTFTVPPQSSVVWLANSVIRLVNFGAGVVTFAGGSGVTVTNAAKTLAQFESAACIRTGSDAWTVVPFSGAGDAANFSNAATGTYTDGGVDFKFITFNSSGTLTVNTAGFADVLVVGGGGAGALGGGGAGGHLNINSAFLPVGSTTITVGAGGAVSTSAVRHGFNGNSSQVGFYISPGGGGGAPAVGGIAGFAGGSGGGGGAVNAVGGSGISLAGNSGGTSNASSNGAGGGGGASAAGSNAGASSGGAGGAGTSTSITGSAVTRGGGGGGAGTSVGAGGAGGGAAAVFSGTSIAGGTNLGGGGGGNNATGIGGAGGSGVVIVLVRTA